KQVFKILHSLASTHNPVSFASESTCKDFTTSKPFPAKAFTNEAVIWSLLNSCCVLSTTIFTSGVTFTRFPQCLQINEKPTVPL
ncbi:hypothetical protein J6590_102934, partial [Homalodisca vitripennis]